MARPREFDEQEVLQAASDLFWTKGYEATSTRDLTARTGLPPSSMYGAFGDKRGLFLRSLDHYLDRLRRKMARLQAGASPAAAITGFFDDTIEGSLQDALQRGCMLVNSALEASPRDPELRDAVADNLQLIETFFRDCLKAAEARGEIAPAHAGENAARELLALLLGVRVLARVRPERALLAGAVEPALAALGLPPLSAVRAEESPPPDAAGA
jgi:TetR/AcrR family transcriptional repressor of nem operon